MNTRYGTIDLYKFICALLIMALHLSYLGFKSNHFATAGIYVEFYFIVTGYFTMLHFENRAKSGTCTFDEQCKRAIAYTLKKFQGIFAYSIPMSMLSAAWYLIFYEGGLRYLLKECSLPLEILLLASPFTKNINYLIPPIWYLSAMFLVFPIICIFCQRKDKYFVYLISFFIPLFYYGYTNANCNLYYYHQILRAVSALFLGVFVYAVSNALRRKVFGRIFELFLTFLEVLLFALTVISTYFSWNLNVINLLCLCVVLIISFSGHSLTRKLNGKIFTALGKISFVIYLYHWIIGIHIQYFGIGHGIARYFVWTLVLSLVIYGVTEYIRKFLRTYKSRKN